MPFVWSEGQQRYRDGDTGRYVAQRTVNGAVDQVINGAAQDLDSMTTDLQAGTITLSDWQVRMVAVLKLLHVGAAAVGRGGWAQMSQSDWGWTGSVLRRQYAYLRAFAQDIATGHQPFDGRLLARAAMYAEAARGTQREMQRRSAQLIGREQERNQLGAADKHCGTCLECTARGWVPIGTLPAVGSRQCLSRCHCSLQFRTAPQPQSAAA